MLQTTRRRRLRAPVPAPTVRTGSGEPLLLLHPFTTSHDVWAEGDEPPPGEGLARARRQLRPGRLAVPVRLVLCEKDLLLPPDRYGTPYVEAMPGADVVVLPEIGHVPMFEAPDLVAETILEHTRAHAVRIADTA